MESPKRITLTEAEAAGSRTWHRRVADTLEVYELPIEDLGWNEAVALVFDSNGMDAELLTYTEAGFCCNGVKVRDLLSVLRAYFPQLLEG